MAGRLPPDRQGHHPPPLRVLAGDADVGRHRAAQGLGRRRLAARRRREDERSRAATPSTRSSSPTRVGVDGFRYYVLAETPYGSDGDFTYEGLDRPLQQRPRQQPRQPRCRASPRWSTRSAAASARRPRADSPLAEAAAAAYAGAAAAWDVVAPSRALDATWSLIRATNAYLEANEPWKAEPGAGGRRGDGRRARGVADRRVLASPAVPRHEPGRSGSGSASRATSPTSACPRRAAWGGYPGGVTVVKGDPLFPRITSSAIEVTGWFDTHCHVHDDRIPGGDRGRRRRSACGGRDGDGHGRLRPRRPRWRRSSVAEPATPTCGPPSGSTRTTPSTASTRSSTCSTAPRRRRRRGGLDYHYDHSPRDVQRAAFAAQIAARPRAPAAAGDPHPRRVGRHVRHPRRRGRARAHDLPLLHGRRRARHGDASTPAPIVSFSGIVTFKTASRLQAAAHDRAARPDPGRDRRALPAPVPHRGQPNQPAWVPLVGGFVADLRGHRGRRPGRHGRGQRTRTVFGSGVAWLSATAGAS